MKQNQPLGNYAQSKKKGPKMIPTSESAVFVDYLLKRFNNSSELLIFLNDVWPLFRDRTGWTCDSIDPAAAYLLKNLNTSYDMHLFLIAHVWPRFKARAKEQRIAAAAAYRKSLKSKGKTESPLSTTMFDLDGSQLTEREIERRANASETVLRKRDGAIVRWTGKRWEPIT
jgi:hypothetical protein